MRKTIEADAAKTHSATIKAKIDGLVQQGKVIPAWVKSGLVEFAASLSAKEADQIDFSESEGTGKSVKKTPSEWFLSFLEAMPRQVHFGEVSGRDKDFSASGDGAAEKIEAMIQQKMAADSSKTYMTAFAEVQREQPGLAKEYMESIRG